MNKPITVRFEEFKTRLADVINDSDLHPFIVELVLKEYLNETHHFVELQYAKDKEIYEERTNHLNMNSLEDVEVSVENENEGK